MPVPGKPLRPQRAEGWWEWALSPKLRLEFEEYLRYVGLSLPDYFAMLARLCNLSIHKTAWAAPQTPSASTCGC